MAKSEKIELKNIILSTDENGELIIKNGNDNDELPFENLSEEILKMINLNCPLNIKISKFRRGKPPIRKPEFKYKCKECGKIIKSTDDELHAKCDDCNVDFAKVEK